MVVEVAVVFGAGVVESDPPPQADAVNRTTPSTGSSLTISVCHLLLEDSEVRYEPQVQIRDDGLFGDADPVVVARLRQFDGDSFDGDAVA